MDVQAFAVGALVDLDPGCDPREVGAAVTTALCGSYDHEGACRWPHNNAIDAGATPARFRTVYVAEPEEAEQVLQRIRDALESGDGWRVVAVQPRPVDEPDRELAGRLVHGPRAGA